MLLEIKELFFAYQMHDEKDLQWHSRVHHHEENQYEIHYFIQGSGQFCNVDKTYTIQPGALYFTRPSETHSLKISNSKDPITYYAILFKIKEESGHLLNLIEALTSKREYHVGSKHRFFFEELKEKSQSKNENARYSAMHHFLAFLYTINEHPSEVTVGDSSNVHIEKALKIMQESILKNITLKDIASQLNLSEAYFNRLFKKKIKSSPMQYMTKLKIEAACSMLKDTDWPIYFIANKLEFYSEFHFSKTFKKFKNVPPSHYRNQLKMG